MPAGTGQSLKDCKDCVANYVDTASSTQCIIYSEDMESHITDLRRVLYHIQAAGFTLRGYKCFFGRSKLSHLGCDYSEKGVSPSAEKIRANTEWPTPISVKEIRSFLGLMNLWW